MGCCTSRQRDSAPSPYAAHSPRTAADASSRNIINAVPSPHVPSSLRSHSSPRASDHSTHHHHSISPSSGSSNQPPVLPPIARHGSSSPPLYHQHQHQNHLYRNRGRNQQHSRPETSAPNSPLRALNQTRRTHTPHHARWTRTQLHKEREDFFDTRVTGRQEIWGVVRLVVELIRTGDVEEAQGVLDAAGCTCPTGEIWRGIFDERGAFYSVPEWVVVEPDGLVDEEDVKERDDDDDDQDVEGHSGGLEGTAEAEDVGEIVKVRARLSDRGTDLVVSIGQHERVAVLVRRVKEMAGLPTGQKLKFGYLGRILHDHESLTAQGWQDGHVLNAFVFQ